MSSSYDPKRIQAMGRPHGMPFRITKIGHVVLNVSDLERSARFVRRVDARLVVRTADAQHERVADVRAEARHHRIRRRLRLRLLGRRR